MPDHTAPRYRLELLAHSSIGCEELARWHLAEWQALYPDDSVATFAADLARCRGDGNLPFTWVLLDTADAVAGSVSLLENDLAGEPQLTPWIANLWVHPAARRRGLGSRLLQHACDASRQRGDSVTYLYTTDQVAFYLSRGWGIVRKSRLSGQAITIMALEHRR